VQTTYKYLTATAAANTASNQSCPHGTCTDRHFQTTNTFWIAALKTFPQNRPHEQL